MCTLVHPFSGASNILSYFAYQGKKKEKNRGEKKKEKKVSFYMKDLVVAVIN